MDFRLGAVRHSGFLSPESTPPSRLLPLPVEANAVLEDLTTHEPEVPGFPPALE
jgi:hypothetical protein